MKTDYRINRNVVAGKDPAAVWWSIVDPIWDDLLSESEIEKMIWNSISPGQSALVSLHFLNAEVWNGGVRQFLGNSSGSHADRALVGLQLIGAKEYSSLLQKIVALFPNGKVPHTQSISFLSRDP